MDDSAAILDLPGATVILQERFLSPGEAKELCRSLLGSTEWEQHYVRMFGREIPSPRLSAWYGDPGAVYRYSGFVHRPLPWTPTLARLRSRVEAAAQASFNSVLLNRYRDGRDSMGWHADDEPELGSEPVIASLSLGATRRMLLRHRTRKDLGTSVALPGGSLLVMAGETQRNWLHAVPRTKRVQDERINLTFRLVL